MSAKVPCDGCGSAFDPNTSGMAYNLGAGPEYFCLDCKPKAAIDEGVATIKTFLNPSAAWPFPKGLK